jgi:cysteinyl-tRNA synthetase
VDVSSDIIQILIEVRQELRERKLYDLADSLRDKLLQKGIELEDTAEGIKWKRK